MEFQDLLAPVAGELDVDEALECWRWLVPGHVRPLVMTAFGDLFLVEEDGGILFLDTIAGTCSRVAKSVADWETDIRNPERLDDWFMPGFVEALRNAGQCLSQGECYDAIHWICLGGDWSVQNFRPTNWSVHFAASGQIHEQVKDLPDGTEITKINYPVL